MSKRKRDPAFTTTEKKVLLDMVEKNFDIIESKKTDMVTNKTKIEQWRKISEEFNTISGIQERDWNVLKICWENLKKKAKVEQTKQSQHYLRTGGGPSIKFNDDPILERVLMLIKPTITGFKKMYDSDYTCIASGSCEATLGSSKKPTIIIENVSTIDADLMLSQQYETYNEVTAGWTQYTPVMLRTMKNPALAIRSPSHDAELPELPPSPLPDIADMQEPITSPRVRYRGSSSRRRPTLRCNKEPQSLATRKIATLTLANAHAEEDHKQKMKILKLQEDKEKIIIKNETLKMDVLKLQQIKEKEKIKQEMLKTNQEKIKLILLEKELKTSNE